ncbi:DUF1850 domain-containing protein [Desulfotomaculum nigrificans]|uniref:DUF1850 domain-containing protein n=1 Tax=Desulfotomaculum nigrificans TaxID=1565 RepID=UPI0001FAE472|nr:DUF1850 domain-containing protein [Desulfotomaculum nigrificans]
MTGWFRQRARAVAAGLVLIILLLLFLVPLPTLLVSEQAGSPVLMLPMLFDKTCSLEYIHSVLKTPVRENFVLAPGNQLQLTSTTFKAYGVGTPYLPSEGKLENHHGEFVLTGLKRRFKEINLGFVPLNKQVLVYRGKKYPFSSYFKADSLVKIQVKPCTVAKIIWQMTLGGR